MDRDNSPLASTPATFQALTEEDLQDPVGQVPSPLMASELRDDNQSTILEASLEDLSMETQGDSHMEMATTIEPTMMEVEEETPEATPCAKRTRSHDGPAQQPGIPHPKAILEGLMKNINLEMEVARKQNEAEIRKNQNKNTPETAVETEVTLNAYTEQRE